MISWDICKQDFQWDGSWRDIYIRPASLDDWRAVFPLLCVQRDIEFLRESGTCAVPETIDASFFTDSRPTMRFHLGSVIVVFYFFTFEEIECDIDPRQVTGQTGLDLVLTFMQQLGDLTHKRTILTPENVPDQPIISYDPVSKGFQYHEATTPDNRDKRAAEIQNSIRRILYQDWSPIGFVGLLPKDEYDRYIGPVYRILASSRSEQELVKYLSRTGDDIAGATHKSSAHYEHLWLVARKLLELDVGL